MCIHISIGHTEDPSVKPFPGRYGGARESILRPYRCFSAFICRQKRHDIFATRVAFVGFIICPINLKQISERKYISVWWLTQCMRRSMMRERRGLSWMPPSLEASSETPKSTHSISWRDEVNVVQPPVSESCRNNANNQSWPSVKAK